jgi:hypothetical protein
MLTNVTIMVAGRSGCTGCFDVPRHTATYGGLTPPTIAILHCLFKRPSKHSCYFTWREPGHSRPKQRCGPSPAPRHVTVLHVVKRWVQSQHQCIS